MYAAGADAGRWQCWGRMVAESYFKIAHCDGVGHPLRSALWIELEFARLWSRTRPGNPHSTKVGNRRPRARASEALQQCLTPRGSGSTGQGLSTLHEPPTPIQYTQPSPSRSRPSCSTQSPDPASRQRRQTAPPLPHGTNPADPRGSRCPSNDASRRPASRRIPAHSNSCRRCRCATSPGGNLVRIFAPSRSGRIMSP